MPGDLFALAGKTALVTGGTRGIGFAIARGFVAAGVRTFVTSRDRDACANAEAELSTLGPCAAVAADLSTAQGVDAVASFTATRTNALDILVNNAGASWGEPVDTFSQQGWDKVMDLNLRSVFFLTQRLLPLIREAAALRPPARILNIGSVEGLRAPGLETYSYAVSKAGIHHLTRMLAKRLAGEAITVNALAPGPFATKMMERVLERMGDQVVGEVPLGRLGVDDDLVGAATYLCSRAGSFVTGHVLPIDGGLVAAA